MPGFTSEEIQAQIERFLTTQVESARTKLGLRDTLAMRDAVYDMLSTSLLLRPDAFFYLVWLTSNRLEGIRAQQAQDVGIISDLSSFLGYRTRRIGSTTELVNAQAAVLELNAGLNSRRSGQGVRGAIGPAVDRFRRSTERFIRSELEPNVVRNGIVTETPEEIRVKISALLVEVLERHEIIFNLVTALTEAVARLDTIQLPQSVVTNIVGRVQDRLESLQTTLKGDSALAESREAMLELLVMRTILTKASTFRAPLHVLAPLAGDPSTLSLTDGLVPGSLTGSVSGPFNYNRLATNLLRVQIGTPITQIDITLPTGSNAFVQSVPLTFPFTPTGSSTIDVIINGGTPLTMSPVGGPYATAVALAAYLTTLVAGLSVQASGNRMVFCTNTFGDSSTLEFMVVGAEIFLTDIPLESVYGRSIGIATREIVGVIGGATAGFHAEEVFEDFGAFAGSVSSGTPSVVDVVVASGVDLILTAQSTSAVSPSLNFELLGVRVGMILSVSAPTSHLHVITGVADNVLTLDAEVLLTETGTYEIGPDFSVVPVGARIELSATDFHNEGSYRVLAGATPGHLPLDRSLLVTPDTVSGTPFTSFLKISALDVGPVDGIATAPANAGLVALGFTASVPQNRGLAGTAEFTGIDLLVRGVKEGDLLRMAYATVPLPEQTITSVDMTSLDFGPGAVFQVGNPSYTLVSARYEAWDVLRAAMQTWLDDEAQSNTTNLEFQVGRLLRGANPSQQITGAIDSYKDGLDDPLVGLQVALFAYVVTEERSILNVLRTLREQGMDRALDLLVTLELQEFFTMSKDSVSYSTYLIRELADVTRKVAPVGRSQKSKLPGEQVIIYSNTEHLYDPVGSDRADN